MAPLLLTGGVARFGRRLLQIGVGRCKSVLAAEEEAVSAPVTQWRTRLGDLRTDWRSALSRESSGSHVCWCSKDEIREIYDQPLLDLVYSAASVHRIYHDPQQVDLARMSSTRVW